MVGHTQPLNGAHQQMGQVANWDTCVPLIPAHQRKGHTKSPNGCISEAPNGPHLRKGHSKPPNKAHRVAKRDKPSHRARHTERTNGTHLSR